MASQPSAVPVLPTVILDCGSSLCRVGFSTSQVPQVIEPSVVGEKKKDGNVMHFIGEKALEMRSELSLRYPIEFGYILDWKSFEVLLQDLLSDKLKCEPENHPFFFVRKDPSAIIDTEKICQILFETHQVPSLYISSSSAMSLYATGRLTGTVVELGEGICVPTPVYEGYPLKHTVQRTMISGSSVTSHLIYLLSESQKDIFNPHLPAHRSAAKSIKEQFCYIAQDYENEIKNFQNDARYTLPDGKEITIGKERIQCTEGLFQQIFFGYEMPGLAECVFRAINRCKEDYNSILPDLFSNIVLCGGSSFFSGLPSRLQKEVQSFAQEFGISHKIEVTHCPHKHAAFYGAALLASDDQFLSMCYTKENYDENGPGGATKLFP